MFLVPATSLSARERDSRPTAESAPGRITRIVLGYFNQLVQPKKPKSVPTTLGDWMGPPVP